MASAKMREPNRITESPKQHRRSGAVGGLIVVSVFALGLVFFAYSTMISWSYYGDRCAEFLFGPRAILPYRCI